MLICFFPAEHTNEQASEIVKEFLEHGFVVSAKHSFQLLKEYTVGDQRYIYNVDFLHPTLEKSLVAKFRDIIDFDITIDGNKIKKLTSICMPYGDILFCHGMNKIFEVAGRRIMLLEPAGVVFSKLRSCTNEKRPRDIFDILLSCEEDPSLWDILNKLSDADHRVAEMIRSYKKDITERWCFFEKCLSEFSVAGSPEIQKELIGEK